MNRVNAKPQTRKKGQGGGRASATRPTVAPRSAGAPTTGAPTSPPPAPSPFTPGSRLTRSRRANRQRLRYIIGGISVAVVVVVVVVALILTRSTGASASALTNPNGLNPAPQMLAVGSKAPDFTLATADGQNVSLSSMSGHPVVLEFFAIWCPHCQNEAVALNQIDTNFASKGEHTLAILANPYGKNYDTSGGTDTRLADRTDLNWFQTTFNVKHPALIDPNFNVVNQYGASSYPTIYIIDSSGIVRFAQSGEVPYQTLADALNQVH